MSVNACFRQLQLPSHGRQTEILKVVERLDCPETAERPSKSVSRDCGRRYLRELPGINRRTSAGANAAQLVKNPHFTHQEKGTAASRALACLSLVVVTERSVVYTRPHAAILEICVRNRTGKGLSAQASRLAPCHSEPLGKPRLTLVSDGNPLR